MENLRVATPNDLQQLQDLDARCFPAGDLARKRAGPGELERGLDERLIKVRETDGKIVAFIQVEEPAEHHVYISAVAVHPDHRGRGYAKRMLDDAIQTKRGAGRSVSVVASPENESMLRLLFSRNFVVRTIMLDYFGPGMHRLYFQYKGRVQYVDSDERFIVPMTAWDHLGSLLASENHAITGLVDLVSGPAFEVSRFEPENVAALQSEEGVSGVNFSGSLLAAITFILGISFTSSNYPDNVRILLIGAAFSCLLSLVIYANASGELSRIRSNYFDRYMVSGNVLSEYGGVLPFLISLPVTFAEVTRSQWLALATAGVVSGVLLFYLRSRFSISSRFHETWTTWVLQILICLAPLTGVLVIKYVSMVWPWTAVTAATLATLSSIYIYRRRGELGATPVTARWTARR